MVLSQKKGPFLFIVSKLNNFNVIFKRFLVTVKNIIVNAVAFRY